MKSRGNKAVRYAVVGLGHIAQVAVLPGFKNPKNSELVALVSADPEKQQKLAQQYNVERVYSYERYDECLSQGIDAVYIALPNHLHRDYSIRALMAGCRAEHAHVPRRASQCSCVRRASTALA